jgi:hypothetical protein
LIFGSQNKFKEKLGPTQAPVLTATLLSRNKGVGPA